MVDATATGDRVETRKDFGTGDEATYAYWMAQEAIADKEERDWIKLSRRIVKRYRAERPKTGSKSHRFNILWSNIQTLKPTLYARTPKPDVRRRFLDGGTPAARYAAMLLDRCLSFACEGEDHDFDAVMKAVVEDRLLPGRAVARVLYVPHYGEPIDEMQKPGASEVPDREGADGAADEAEGGETNAEFENRDDAPAVLDSEGDEGKEAAKAELARKVTYEEVIAAYVFWEDYREGPARQWKEVPWVRYRSYLNRDELVKRFGKKKGKLVNLDYTPRGSGESVKEEPPADVYKKAIVHEIWDKTQKKAIWLAPGTPDLILDSQDDPLELPDFFPNPDPLLANSTNDKRVPVPDYEQYVDQAEELDTLTARIDRLTRALKVAGVYAGEEKQVLQQLLDEGTENRLIPVGDLTSWTDKGGMKGVIEWLPIQQIAETLIQLYNARDRVKAILYEITGIGDIMRGMTSPDETLGAQELKANFSTRRITPQQKDVAKFARGLLRLMAAVVANHFSNETISKITGYPQLAPVPALPPAPQAPPQVLAEIMTRQQTAAQPSAPPPGGPPPMSPGAPGGSPAPQAPQPPPLSPQAQQYMAAMASWQQQQQQVQQIQAANQQKQQEFDAACELIRQDGVHGFKIDIEADSTIAPDEQAEKASRTEFLGKFIPLMEQVVPMAMGNPALAELSKEIVLFGVRAFPAARGLEETVEKAFDALAKMPPHPSQQPPQKDSADSPQALALRGHEIDSRAQIEQQKNAVKMADIASKEQTETMRIAAEQQRHHDTLALETEHSARQQALAAVRMTHLESRDAGHLA